ncbi:DUF4407 domain-containing protein [Nitrosomonas sp. wSCUT-2]
MDADNKSDRLLNICCAITFMDADLVRQCNGSKERQGVLLHALGLVASLVFGITVWGGLVFTQILPIWGAILGGILVSLIICLLELAFFHADWEPKGILSERTTAWRKLCHWMKIGLRLLIAFCIAQLTGAFGMLWFYQADLDNQLEKNRQQHNAPIETEYRAAKERLYADMLETPQNDHKTVTQERQILINRLHQLRSDLQMYESAASDARIGWKHELESGKGRKFRAFEAKEEEATRHAARIQHEFKRDSARLAELDRQLETMEARILAAQARFEAGHAQLIAERDAKLLPARSDLGMRQAALGQLKQDETYGGTLTFHSKVIEYVLITFEMIFFIMMLNKPASIYTALLRERTRTEARQIQLDYELTRANLEAEFSYRGKLNLRQFELQYGAELRKLEADYANNGLASPLRAQSFATAGTTDSPLFDPSAASCPAAADQSASAQDAGAQAQTPAHDGDCHRVIGGEADERISTAEAMTNPERYWVNPDNPKEIWLQAFRKQLFH